ncbi:MAG: NUDIX hydrolase [Aestuariivita sp.]|nr:NUDIX hydrolase [Aestuariivita sp.]
MTLRLAVRSVLIDQNKLLLVNAWKSKLSTLWCAPGGGVNAGESLPDNLVREVQEETGLTIAVGQPCLVNEFHNPRKGFHQVEVFFRCELTDGSLDENWIDPGGVVSIRRWFSREEAKRANIKPSSLTTLAWGNGLGYDSLEHIVF